MITAVVFDAFGTVLELRSKLHPFRQLLKDGIPHGRTPSPNDVRVLMSNPWSLEEAASQLGISISPTRLKALQGDLEREIASISPFEDGVEAVAMLRADGVRVGICSNLCEPYGAAVLKAFPDLNAYALSHQVGAMKPDAVIYWSICSALGVTPGEMFGERSSQIAMVGDSIKCDRDGPSAVGMLGFHLDRAGREGVRNLVQFAHLVIGSRRESAIS
ncbi:HAD family hydrolase [Pseudomonas syringae pv. syringae]|nr:HAD family hydrolase [Pseudomonas syringae pv. syringae]